MENGKLTKVEGLSNEQIINLMAYNEAELNRFNRFLKKESKRQLRNTLLTLGLIVGVKLLTNKLLK